MLIGTRLTIGPIFPEDFGLLFCWANDVAAARLDLAYRPIDLISHRQWCESIGQDPTKIIFAIRRLNETPIIGYVNVMNIHPVHRSADIGLRIGEEKNRGQGYGKEALGLAMHFCWSHANLNRLQLIVFKHNRRAVSAYTAVGFKKEGLLRKAVFIDGEWIDVVTMAALRPGPKKHRISGRTPALHVMRATREPLSAPGAAAG